MKRLIRKNNRGSAIIVVLVTVAFVFILITTLLFVTLSNILMKYSDARNKNNFYTAETVVEQIKAGLENKSSAAFSEAYKSSLTYYSGGEKDTMVARYLANVTDELCKAGQNDEWDETKLLEMVDEGLIGNPADPYVSLDVDEFKSEAAGARPHKIVHSTTAVTLENVYVKYTSPADGTVSIIQTNYVLSAPAGSFSYSSQLPDIFDYAIIAGQHMVVAENTEVISEKSIYGGDYGIDIGEKKEGSLTMTGRRYLITKGTVSLNGQASGSREGKLVTDRRTYFYAGELEVNKGVAELGGLTTVSDDLAYKGAGRVTVSGSYIGFGDSETDARSSSAVLINAKKAELDTSKAEQVLLYGHAFIGEDTGAESSSFPQYDGGGDRVRENGKNVWTNAKNSVIMGQSVAARADQVAYMIPPECIGVVKGANNTVLIGENPVMGIKKKTGTNEPDYSDRVSSSVSDFRIVDFERQADALGGHYLKEFSPDELYAVRYVRSQYGDTLAYFYLIMTPDKAEEYLKLYYENNRARADKYFKFYEPDLSGTGDAEKTVTEGQSFTTSGNTVTMREAGNPGALAASSRYRTKYLNLCAKLVESGVQPEELNRNIFDNLLFSDDVEAKVSSGETITCVIGSGDEEVRGVLTGEDNFVYGDHDGDEKIKVIISTGDVTVKKNFDGLIIAGGTITFRGGQIKLGIDRTGTARALQTVKLAGGGKAERPLIRYFRGWEQYPLEGIATVSEDEADESVSANMDYSEYTDYSELVHYENYSKK
ncbi:MAG: hypothetical protein K5985_06515 [Lachnospiraceae bacterium]|nr:hypothetical protein [Lachnospiraceae bacterium]